MFVRAKLSALSPLAMFILCTSMCCVSGSSAAEPTPQQVDDSRAKALVWLFKTQKSDGGWGVGSGLQVQATSAVLNAYMNAGIKSGAPFYAGVANLANAQPSSIDGQARQIDTLRRAGNDVTALAGVLLFHATNNTNPPYKSWGSLPGYSTSVADTALAASALMSVSASGYAGYPALVCNVFDASQNADQGWSYSGRKSANGPSSLSFSAVVPTAYTILALQKIALLGAQINCNPSGSNISKLMTDGAAFLKSKQHPDGGFGDGSGASGALETALSYMAIKAVNSNDSVLPAAISYLVNNQSANGSWADDSFQTAVVLQSFPVVALANKTKDGIPDVVKAGLNLDVNVSSRGILPGNGYAVAGDSRPGVVLGATLAQAINYSFPATRGDGGGYYYVMESGSMPNAVSLATNGSISGVPTDVGIFNSILKRYDGTRPKVVNNVVTTIPDVNSPITYIDLQIAVTAPLGATSVSVVADMNPTTKNRSTALIATVIGKRPTGVVSFYDGNALLGAATLYDSDASVGDAKSSFQLLVNLPGGFRKIMAIYSGDARNQGATSNSFMEIVNPLAAVILNSAAQ